MKFRTPRKICLILLVVVAIAGLLAGMTPGMAQMVDDPDALLPALTKRQTAITAFKKSLAEYKSTNGTSNAQLVLECDSLIASMESKISSIHEFLPEVKSRSKKMNYLKQYEIEPKMREVEQIRKRYQQTRAELNMQQATLNAAIKDWNSRCGGREANESCVGERAELQARQSRIDKGQHSVDLEGPKEIGPAVHAVEVAQKEYDEVKAKHDIFASKVNDLAQEYSLQGVHLFEIAQLLSKDLQVPPSSPTSQPSQKTGFVHGAKTSTPQGNGTDISPGKQVKSASVGEAEKVFDGEGAVKAGSLDKFQYRLSTGPVPARIDLEKLQKTHPEVVKNPAFQKVNQQRNASIAIIAATPAKIKELEKAKSAPGADASVIQAKINQINSESESSRHFVSFADGEIKRSFHIDVTEQ